MSTAPLVAAFGFCVLLPGAFAQNGVRWTASFDEALAAAKADNKVLVLAFNMAGERANDELVADHYKDPTIGRLSACTVNVFCSIAAEPRVPGVSPAQQQAAEKAARLQVLKIGPGEDVIAPQHVFVGPDGTVLTAVPYRVTKGELEWTWADAIKRVDPSFAWQLSAAARAPARLGFGAAEHGQNQKPPTKEQIDEALKQLKKSRGGILRNLQHVDVLMRSDDPEAMQFVQSTLNGLPAGAVATSLDTIGVISPKAWHAVVTGYLGDRDESVRYAAAAALEHLAEPKAFAPLLKQCRTEKAERVRGRLLRAVASCGPAQKEAVATIEKVLAKEPSADLRAHAVLALALIEDRAKVQEKLAEALRDASPKVRATVAFALASRRETELARKLEEAAATEAEPDTKAWLDAAVAVVRGGAGDAFKNFLQRELGERPVRAGAGEWWRGGGANGGGDGGGGRRG
jgi:tetratricopeptide (TPR) repeat protein